ncbi:MAG: transketolase family protein [Candidatus Doudnabacteria bacterium]|nr:transketolase family protein [Candidatus Doudnabacteria bacterium]
MKSKQAKTQTPTEMSIRDGFGEGFLAVGKLNPLVVGLSADLTESVRMQEFEAEFPQRFVQVGIAEQNMAAVAAGMALEGFIPYIGSFACFQPYRNLDQIRTSICIQKANVKIVSSHAGFSYAGDGIQIQALEDIAIMRSLPNMQVWVPADADQAKEMALSAAGIDGPIYIRLGREKTPLLSRLIDGYEDKGFKIGEAQQLKFGSDFTIVTYGYMVAEAWRALNTVSEIGLHGGLLNIHTIKPLDIRPILENVAQTKRLLVVEEHQAAGGVGELLAKELLAAGLQFDFAHIAVNDKFGDTAETTRDLWQLHGLTAENIVQVLKGMLR